MRIARLDLGDPDLAWLLLQARTAARDAEGPNEQEGLATATPGVVWF